MWIRLFANSNFSAKVALLRKSSLCVIDMTEKHTFKNKRFLVSGIQHDTPILDFTSSNTGHELFVATFRDKALEIRVSLIRCIVHMF